MWTPTTRVYLGRAGLRYGSDLIDGKWRILALFLTPPGLTGRTSEC